MIILVSTYLYIYPSIYLSIHLFESNYLNLRQMRAVEELEAWNEMQQLKNSSQQNSNNNNNNNIRFYRKKNCNIDWLIYKD